ncbi:MAG: endolytic transglycosylase MltG [Oscillospiraceae bacterium]|nr:endolytic transglycosylase MltG [Oscillospiraceae bacterium]
MSDEEKKIPVTGEDSAPGAHWDGPANRKWPRVLGGPAAGEETAPVPRLPREQEREVPPTPEMVELTPEEFSAIAGETAAPETAPGTETTGSANELILPVPTPELPAVPKKKRAGIRRRKRVRSPAARKRAAERKKAKEARAEKREARRKKRQIDPDPWEVERDYRPIRGRRDGRIGCLGGLMYATFIISLSIVLAVFMWMAASDVLALNKAPVTAEVTLPVEIFSDKRVEIKDDSGKVTDTKTVQSADVDALASILKDAGLINYKWLFRLYSGFSHADQKVDPGTYTLSTTLDYRALVTRMRAGADSQLQTLIMFPEGFNMDQVFERLEENGVCSREALYEAAASTEFSYAFLENMETGDPYRLEGYLFPDSYYFYQGMQASSAINKFLSNLHYRITEEMWQKAGALGLTFREAMTVASMIEKEAANDDERPLIASVIYNRLAAGMPLQVDSTVVYARRDTGDSYISPEIIQETDSPYNTYLYEGLPPGPICNPGMVSIQAALNPAATRYYYFALEVETDSVKFFTNYADFEAFVATQDYGQRSE